MGTKMNANDDRITEECGLVKRYENNPILSSKELSYDSALVFNAGVCKWKGKYVMVFRNDYGISPSQPHGPQTNLGVAFSDDGYNWTARKEPSFSMESDEIRRIYDPRLTVIEDKLHICFACDTKHGVRGGVGILDDDITKIEIKSLSTPDNRNMVLFPRKINGRYWRLERPFPVYGTGGDYFDIWTSQSNDLVFWGESNLLLSGSDVSYSNQKIGPAAPPIETPEGWLTTFHAVEVNSSRGKNGWEEKWTKRYYAGIMLLDLENPNMVRGIAKAPLMSPNTEYERNGFRNDVIFPGALVPEEDGSVKIYYGAADTVECVATASITDLVALCLN